MCFEWFTKGQHDLESDVQQQLFKEKILKLESYEITMNGKEKHQNCFFSSLNFILFFSAHFEKQRHSLVYASGLCLMHIKIHLYKHVYINR